MTSEDRNLYTIWRYSQLEDGDLESLRDDDDEQATPITSGRNSATSSVVPPITLAWSIRAPYRAPQQPIATADGLLLTISAHRCHPLPLHLLNYSAVQYQLRKEASNKPTSMRCWYQSLHRCQSTTFDMASSKNLELIHHLSIIFQQSAHDMHMIVCFLLIWSWEMTTNNKLDADAELRHVAGILI